MSLSKLTPESLKQAYEVDLLSVEEIAKEAGCSVANIRKRLKDWDIKRGKAAIIGKPSWNAGLTKETSESMQRVSESKTGDKNPMFGKQPWNEGLTKETDKRVAVVSEKLTGRDVSEETRAKQSAAKQGKRGAETNNFGGGRQIRGGYSALLTGNVNGQSTYEYEHRAVAAQYLGKDLTEDEHVHHCDLDRFNNDPANLLILSNAGHGAIHAAMNKIAPGRKFSRNAQVNWLRNHGYWCQEV